MLASIRLLPSIPQSTAVVERSFISLSGLASTIDNVDDWALGDYHGQKWSIFSTQRSIMLQWCVQSGFQCSHSEHHFGLPPILQLKMSFVDYSSKPGESGCPSYLHYSSNASTLSISSLLVMVAFFSPGWCCFCCVSICKKSPGSGLTVSVQNAVRHNLEVHNTVVFGWQNKVCISPCVKRLSC